MKRIRLIINFCVFAMFTTACSSSNVERNYSVIIAEYDENGSHIKYPQIDGLKDRGKQDSMNYGNSGSYVLNRFFTST